MKTLNNNLNHKNIKTVLVTIAIIFSLLISNVYAAGGGNNLNDQIKETVKLESLHINKNTTEFVRVSFKINADGHVEILEMNYSNEAIKNQLIQQLKKMTIYGSIDIQEVYNYKFSFIKL